MKSFHSFMKRRGEKKNVREAKKMSLWFNQSFLITENNPTAASQRSSPDSQEDDVPDQTSYSLDEEEDSVPHVEQKASDVQLKCTDFLFLNAFFPQHDVKHVKSIQSFTQCTEDPKQFPTLTAYDF